MEITQKWGFGMAPPKPSTQARRHRAVTVISRFLQTGAVGVPLEEFLECLSEVKGLFNRVARQDQWDWFTVAGQLGYPSEGLSGRIAKQIGDLRQAMKLMESDTTLHVLGRLEAMPAFACLSVFLGEKKIHDEDGCGWVYVLSTRDYPDTLKIGMTTRTVEMRVKEINSATGVVIPFGVRHCRRVTDPTTAERLVHHRLAMHRMRADREFFRLDFHSAKSAIGEVLREHGLEIRTLERLSALA